MHIFYMYSSFLSFIFSATNVHIFNFFLHIYPSVCSQEREKTRTGFQLVKLEDKILEKVQHRGDLIEAS